MKNCGGMTAMTAMMTVFTGTWSQPGHMATVGHNVHVSYGLDSVCVVTSVGSSSQMRSKTVKLLSISNWTGQVTSETGYSLETMVLRLWCGDGKYEDIINNDGVGDDYGDDSV